MRKKYVIHTNYCKGCIWLVDGRLCPFRRCVRGYGWVAEKNTSERRLRGFLMGEKFNSPVKKQAEELQTRVVK
mgnify:CR=1 FL=1